MTNEVSTVGSINNDPYPTPKKASCGITKFFWSCIDSLILFVRSFRAKSSPTFKAEKVVAKAFEPEVLQKATPPTPETRIVVVKTSTEMKAKLAVIVALKKRIWDKLVYLKEEYRKNKRLEPLIERLKREVRTTFEPLRPTIEYRIRMIKLQDILLRLETERSPLPRTMEELVARLEIALPCWKERADERIQQLQKELESYEAEDKKIRKAIYQEDAYRG